VIHSLESAAFHVHNHIQLLRKALYLTLLSLFCTAMLTFFAMLSLLIKKTIYLAVVLYWFSALCALLALFILLYDLLDSWKVIHAEAKFVTEFRSRAVAFAESQRGDQQT